MSLWKKLPWLSLILLLLTYTTFGWLLSQANIQLITWVLVAIAIVIFVFYLTIPWSRIADYSMNFFRSSFRSFGLALFGAFLFFLILARFRLFLDVLVLTGATMLVRIDLQVAGFREGLTFWMTIVFSLIGLGLGAALEKMMSSYFLIS